GAGGGGSTTPGGKPLNGPGPGGSGGPPSTPPAGPPCGMQTPPLTSFAFAGGRPGAKKSSMSANGAVLQPDKVSSNTVAASCTERTIKCRRRSDERLPVPPSLMAASRAVNGDPPGR